MITIAKLLADRSANVEPVLAAVRAGGHERVHVGLHALSQKIELLLPRVPEVLAAIVPSATLSASASDRHFIRVSIAGARIDVAIVHAGPLPARSAVDEVMPEGAREAWLPVVEALLALPSAMMMNRNAYVTDTRASITISTEARNPAEESALSRGIEDHLVRIGVPGIRRSLWKHLFRVAASRRLAIKTFCTASGPAPELAAQTDLTSLDEALALLELIGERSRVTAAAAELRERVGAGELAGVELLVGTWAPDLIVWLPRGVLL